jgi:predicted acylesterase/phospholipase RssA/CRP-like cAMP-binding protein
VERFAFPYDCQRLLADRPICAGLDSGALRDLEAAMEPVRVAGGEQILRRGQSDVPLILVARGAMRASFVDETGQRRVVFEYFRGASIGEALVLSRKPAPLDLHAIRDSVLLCLTPDRFSELATKHPEVVLHFARLVASRLVDALSSQEILSSLARGADHVPRIVAILVDGGDDVRRTRDLVVDALRTSRNAICLTGEVARRVESEDGDGMSAYDQYFDRASGHETRSGVVVLECERSDGRWLDFCLRQADRVMIIVEAGQSLDWLREMRVAERNCHLELASVHPATTALPRGAPSSDVAGVSRHLNARSGDRTDAGRLARWLLDCPVGLVLGGGGARGIAHVGVLKALEEARVPVDIVGGTSIGAIFAGGVARGWSADEIMLHVRRIFSSRFALYDPTLPLSALLAGKKLEHILRGLFEDIEIADLWVPFFCVSTNISRAFSEVHDRGPLWSAIRSSCSIPGLYPPFRRLEQLLVDGGLMDNLPVDVMAEHCRGPVVAVDVFPYERRRLEPTSPSPGRLPLRERFDRMLSQAGPWLFDVLVRATLAGSQRMTSLSLVKHPPALYLTPELSKFGVLDWRAYEALYEAGYQAARRQLEGGALPRSLWDGQGVEN